MMTFIGVHMKQNTINYQIKYFIYNEKSWPKG